MEIFALFDNYEYEKVSLDFLQPNSKANSVEINFLAKVPDNVRESADRGVKEAYLLLSKHFKQIPNKLSVWCRGFDINPHGNSTDLAFAVSLICHMLSEGHIKSVYEPSLVCATGVINKAGEVIKVNGIREKLITAAKLCKEDIEGSLILIPEENMDEYNILMENDEFREIIGSSDLRIVGVKSLRDVLSAFKIQASAKANKKVIIGVIACGLAALAVCFTVLLSKDIGNVVAGHLFKGSQLSTTGIKQLNTPINIPKPDDDNRNNKSESTLTKPVEQKITPKETLSKDTPTGKPTESNASEQDDKDKKITQAPPPKKEDNAITTPFGCSGQAEVTTNAPKISIVFDEAGIKEGPAFEKIEVYGDGCNKLNIELNKSKNSLDIDVLGRYGKTINVDIPQGAVILDNGRKNSQYSYSLTPLNDKRLLFDKVTNRSLEGWLTETKKERISTFTIGDNPAEVHSGSYSAKIISTEENNAKYKYLLRGIRKGSNYRLVGFIKTKDAETNAGASLSVALQYSEASSKNVTGTSDWQLVSFEFNSGDLDRLEIECRLIGKGTAWFDDITIEELL